MKYSHLIIAIAGFYVTFIWAIVVPIFQAPDEPAHFNYIQYIAERRHLPKGPYMQPEKASDYLETALNLTNFYDVKRTKSVTMQFFNGDKGINEYSVLVNDNNPLSENNNIYPALDYPPLYYILNVPLYKLFYPNILAQVIAIRLFSAIMTLLLVLISYYSFILIFKDRTMALFLSLILAFYPMLNFIGASINNDNLINLLYFCFFYVLFIYWKRSLSISFILLMILLFFLAWYTKLQAVFMVPFLFIYLFIKRREIDRVNKNIRLSLFTVLIGFTVYVFSSVIPFSKLFAFIERFTTFFTIGSFLELFFLQRYSRMFKSLFARFGWLDTLVDPVFYAIFLIIILALMACTLIYWIKVKKDDLLLFCTSCIIITDLSYGFFYIYSGYESGFYFMPTQGRYYFFLFIPIFVVLFRGLSFLVSAMKRNFIMASFVLMTILFNFISLVYYVIPRFYV